MSRWQKSDSPGKAREDASAVENACLAILAARRATPVARATLVALSGIDASRKGYLAAGILDSLARRGVRAAGLSADPWLNLPAVRFSSIRPAEHFYHHAIRFEPLFRDLVLPLKETRACRVEANVVEETSTSYRRRQFEYSNVEVVLLEGIFLFKRAFRPRYDLALWVRASFETALARALRRRQEGLGEAETVRAY